MPSSSARTAHQMLFVPLLEDRDVDVVVVVCGVAASVLHHAPAGAAHVVDALAPDDVLDAQGAGVGDGVLGDLVALGLGAAGGHDAAGGHHEVAGVAGGVVLGVAGVADAADGGEGAELQVDDVLDLEHAGGDPAHPGAGRLGLVL